MGLGFRIIEPPQTPNEGRVDINYNFSLLSGVTAINLTGLTSGVSTFDIVSGTSENGLLSLVTDGGSAINIVIPTVSNRVVSGFSSSYTSDFELNVEVGTYNINNTSYTTSETNLTIASSEVFDRLDAIVGDSSSGVTVISGTSSKNPTTPVIPDDKVLISYVNIPGQTSQQVFNGDRAVKRPGLPSVNAGGTTVSEWIDNYFFPFLPATLSINSFSLQEVGTTYNPTITYTIDLNDETVVTERRIIDVTNSNAVVNNPLNNSASFGANPVTTNNTWRNEADVDNDGSPTTIVSSISTVSFIYPWLYGKFSAPGVAAGVNRPSANQSLIDSAIGVLVANSAGTITAPFNSSSNDYLWFATPATVSYTHLTLPTKRIV